MTTVRGVGRVAPASRSTTVPWLGSLAPPRGRAVPWGDDLPRVSSCSRDDRSLGAAGLTRFVGCSTSASSRAPTRPAGWELGAWPSADHEVSLHLQAQPIEGVPLVRR